MVSQSVRNFGKVRDVVEIPDLVAIQKRSYERFLQADVVPTKRNCIGLESLFREIFPIVNYDKTMRLEYLYYELEKPRYTPNECRQLRLTYGYPLKICCRLRTKEGEDLAEQSIYLGEMPVMIGGGEFIFSGAERVIVSQLHRSPGVDFLIESKEGDRVLHGGRIIPERGSWIEIGVTRKDVLVVKIDQSSKIPATIFLRAIGPDYGTTAQILRLFYPTKTVSASQLTPDMRAVEPIADTETGEIIVKAGAQIGDKVSLIQQISLEPKIGVTQNKITEHLRDELEFKYVSVQNLFEDDEKKLKSFLEFIENRLMLFFGDSEKDDEKTAHLPRFNTKNKEVPKNDKKKISEFEVRWDKEATKEQKDILEECKKKINDKTAWYSDPKDAKDKNPDFKNPGLYFFRNKKTKDVKHGYIGIAGERRGEGLYERMQNSHYSENPGDSLRKRIEEFLIKQLAKGEKEDGKAKKSKKSSVEVEVIEEVRDALILNTLAEDDCPSHEQALLKFYMRLRPGNPANEKKAKAFFVEKFSDVNRYRLGRVGRFRLNRKFGQTVDEGEMTLRPEDFINTMKYVMALRNNEGTVDDIDHLGNRRLRTIDELAGDEIRKGLLRLRKTVQERMSMKRDVDEQMRIADLVNSKSVSSSINYFFGRGELSQIVDQTNALSQLTHERRLSALGPGGLNRRRAGFEVRDVHISHYGRICPVETPEGTNIGLISSLAIFATIDEYGFLLTPYRRVEKGKATDKVDYLRADEDTKAVIAAPNTFDPDTREIQKGIVLAMKGGELTQVPHEDVNYVDVSAKQIVGVSASLIPFLEHDDANRALMGSNMQRQAVPLLKAEVPLVGTGMEKVIGQNSSMVVRAKSSGVVTSVDATKIVINHTEEYELAKFVGLNERTCLNQNPTVKLGEKVQEDQIIADGGGTANGVLALGKNVLVGFVSFDGFNFEDAIVISEKLVKNDSFTSIHIDEFTSEVRETRLGREEFTRDIPNVSEKALRNLDEHGVIREGTRVCSDDILVGKVVPKSKTELTPEEKLLHAIFGRAGEDVKNDSLELPSGNEGVVIKTERFTRRGAGGEEQKKALNAQIKEYEKQMRAKECVIFRQMIEAIHKKFDVNIIDPSTRQKVGVSTDDEVIYEQVEGFNVSWVRPASVRDDVQKIMDKFWARLSEIQEEKKRRIESLKHGNELASGVLEMVKVYIATKRTLSIGDKMAGRHGNKGVIAKIMPEEDMPFLEDGTPLDILLNPLGVPSRMNVGQILETHLGWAAKVLGFSAITPVFDGATEDDIQKLTAEANEYMKERALKFGVSVGDIVDTDKGGSITQEQITEYMKDELEFAYFPTPDLPKEDTKLEEILEDIENRLMLEFRDNEKLDVTKRHIPRFNKKTDKRCKDAENLDGIKEFISEFDKCDKEKIKIFKKCIEKIKDKTTHWYSEPKEVKEPDSKEPGLYFFRNKKSKDNEYFGVNHGYVGMAGLRQGKGILDRIGRHYSNDAKDSLRISIKEWLERQGNKGKSQSSKGDFDVVEPPPQDELFVNVPKSLKTQLYDGRTGEPFDQTATIGYIYMMKLHHLVDDKIHARATGPYSLITQQPLGGKARTGGQRFGEMEVWALEGYGAAFTLQEMLTVKSDDVEGRTKIYESMVKGQNRLEAGTPLSFDVLCNELRGLGLNIQLEKKRLGSAAL